jgi:hypothetical protein
LSNSPLHHAGHLFVQQHQVAHDHRAAVVHRLERGIGAEGEAGLDGDALDADLQARAGHANAEDVTRHHRAALAEDLLDGRPVDGRLQGGSGDVLVRLRRGGQRTGGQDGA